ncbi:hypothetical protein PPRY_a2600 [Pseudoalteromonas prydzensis ACAM 620]|nr:hypothetical protein [Pseudoalteromonas prydzensis ACAM 620]MCF6144409.1 hypothetical protein [Pseudoalteromonas mariniglutinosa NCIMB 1770]
MVGYFLINLEIRGWLFCLANSFCYFFIDYKTIKANLCPDCFITE